MPTNEDVLRSLSSKQQASRRESNPNSRHLVLEGMLVGKPEDYTFDANAPHTYCRLCGMVFQTPKDRRSVHDPSVRIDATARRKRWSHEHAATHSLAEHQALAASGRYMTAEAALRLIPLGIIPITDMVFNPDTAEAAAKAPRLDPDVQDRMEELG